MKHLMVDIETIGTRPGSAITWLAAAFFDLESGEMGATFEQAITIQSNLDAGLTINPNTAVWWMKQEPALTAWALAAKVDLKKALELFGEFVATNSVEKDFEIWGNSNRFDMGLMEAAYQAVDMKICWKFRNERDVRTFVRFNPKIKEACIKSAKESNQVVHNPLVDSILQIIYLCEINKTITVSNEPIEDDGLLNE